MRLVLSQIPGEVGVVTDIEVVSYTIGMLSPTLTEVGVVTDTEMGVVIEAGIVTDTEVGVVIDIEAGVVTDTHVGAVNETGVALRLRLLLSLRQVLH